MSDSMQTTVLTVGVDGTVDAVFTGHVHASGLDLAEANGAPNSANRVEWLDRSNQAVREAIWGDESGGPHGILAQANVADGSEVVRVIDEAGVSSFLRNALPSSTRVHAGFALCAFEGGTSVQDFRVPHHLGRTCQQAICQAAALDDSLWELAVDVGGKDEEAFTARITFITGFEPAAGTVVRLDYVAFG